MTTKRQPSGTKKEPGTKPAVHAIEHASPPLARPDVLDYPSLLDELKVRIRTAQIQSVLAMNRGLIVLYWDIGRSILARQSLEGWGAKVVERLSKDLRREFRDLQGLSARNLQYMRAFAEAYPDAEIVQRVVAQLPWGHNVTLLEKLKDTAARLWYAEACSEHGWTRPMLAEQIDKKLIQRQGKAATNFHRTLPAPQSALAQQATKDPYFFDFLPLRGRVEERELERGLEAHIREFLLELGVGFAYLGRQVPLAVSGREYRLDLLFYHVRLHCYVVVELKGAEFKPEHAGKLNFYLSAVDDLLRGPGDHPSIGLLLCASHDRVIVEYALRDVHKPIGVAEWQSRLTESLPDDLKGQLPTVEDFEAELSRLRR